MSDLIYFLADADSFYTSAERVYNPALRYRPLCVLSNGDSTIVAMSREAKALGIKKFSFYSDAVQHPRANEITFLSSNYELYNSVSNSMHSVISEFSDDNFVYSIDEQWICCRMNPDNALEYAAHIRREVWRRTRIPVSIGCATTLTLSKAASKIAKSNGIGVHFLSPSTRELQALESKDIWGVGTSTAKQLSFMGINDALKLSQLSVEEVRKSFSVNLKRTVLELNGTRCYNWNTTMPDKQQIITSRTLGVRPCKLDDLHQVFCELIDIASAKARKQKSRVKTLSVTIRTTMNDPNYYSKKAMVSLEYPTNDVVVLTKAVKSLVSQIYKFGSEVSKVGVCLLDLKDAKQEQLDLFAPDSATDDKLMGVYDSLTRRYGKSALYLAASGSNKSAVKRELLTPKYTTRWTDIPLVRA